VSGSADPVPARAPPEGVAGTELCVLLACFAGRSQATKIRRQLDKRLGQSGGAILDEVIVAVNAKGKARVHDPRRTLAGTLTPALTWGIFGLLAGGLESLAVWAVAGAICGGLYAYYYEHLLTKDELKRIGGRLPSGSSAIVAFVRGPDPQRVLSCAASFEPATASVAAVTADLSAQVYSRAAPPATASATPDQVAELSMLLVRFVGQHAAREALGKSGSTKHQDQKAPLVELFIEANEHGRRRVIAPTTGSADFAKLDAPSWGIFGVAWGLIVGFAGGDGGVLGPIENGLVIGILWGLFGLVAGVLYGLWAGRGVSARRLKGLGPFVPPDTSLVVAWADGSLSREAIERWAAPGSQRLILRFIPVGHGAVLEV
jgi:uncharacterized membrane protein